MHRQSTYVLLVLAAALAAVLSVLVPAGASSQDPANPEQMRVAAMESLGLERARLAYVDLIDGLPASLEVPVAIDGDTMVLEVTPWMLRSPEFRMRVQDESGELVEREAPAPRTYRGSVVGRKNSDVAVAVRPNGQLEATVLVGDKVFVLQPVSDVVEHAADTLHVFYRTTDVEILETFSCGVFEMMGENGLDDGESSDARGAGDDIFNCEIAFDADREFYQLNGSSVGNTIADIEAVMARVITIYERDVQITYTTTETIIRTSEPDPYSTTDAGGLLNQFAAEWNGPQNGVPRDVAHLMTGKNINGGTIGIATLGTICNLTSAYGLSQSRFSGNMSSRAALTAHELGHNWGSGHCSGGDCRIMCPGLGGCSGDISQFGQGVKNTIIAFRNSRNCLDIVEEPLSLPFIDTFDAGLIDDELWSSFDGISVVEFAGNEITPPASMNLDGVNSEESDQIVSFPMLLGGESNVVLSYFVKQRGVDAGESLDVEYFGSNNQWNLIETIVSDGTDTDYFELHHTNLTGNALHDEFRLRMTANVDFVIDDFFIDNVSICAGSVGVSVTPDAVSVPAGGSFTFDASVTNLVGFFQASSAWIDVSGPDGTPVYGSGNPRFGPKAFTLNGGQTKSRNNLPLNIPGSTPPGTGYRVIAYVGDINTGEVCAVAEFEFEVTP